jgi:AraC-like DNA-binding protein
VGLSRSRLEHLFKQELGISMRRYLCRVRLQTALRSLANRALRISEIAYQVGFAHPSNFDHAFRQEYGVSPRRYRSILDAQSSLAESTKE